MESIAKKIVSPTSEKWLCVLITRVYSRESNRITFNHKITYHKISPLTENQFKESQPNVPVICSSPCGDGSALCCTPVNAPARYESHFSLAPTRTDCN
jgi:hypothetical protein